MSSKSKTRTSPCQTGSPSNTESGDWIRLFPVPFRYLEAEQQFKKYQWITARVRKASDARRESHHPDLGSIKIGERIGTKAKWAERKAALAHVKAHCLCCLKRAREDGDGSTLGFFKPRRIKRLLIEGDDSQWSDAQLATLSQGDFFRGAPQSALEKIPFKFKYEFTCDDDSCKGHSLSCTDWELAAAYRRWRRDYGDSWESAFRNKFEREMIELNDTHLFVGTVHRYPKEWINVGLFYPRI